MKMKKWQKKKGSVHIVPIVAGFQRGILETLTEEATKTLKKKRRKRQRAEK